jgi:predicted membrane protein
MEKKSMEILLLLRHLLGNSSATLNLSISGIIKESLYDLSKSTLIKIPNLILLRQVFGGIPMT